eukprot:scaffold21561_cov90-Isochrysis_galbana.AAC.1
MFISSSDNLGATMDLTLLNWFAQSEAPFLMEARKQAGAKGRARERRAGNTVAERLPSSPRLHTDPDAVPRPGAI